MTFSKERTVHFLGALALLLFLSACTMAGKPAIGSGVKAGQEELPTRLLLLPLNVSVNEISAGGLVQEDPEWSREGEEALTLAVNDYFAAGTKATLVKMPELTKEQSDLVHEHVLLYEVVAGQAYIAANVPVAGWGHLANDFHYTIGNGLRFLKEKSGADAALIVIGSDNISSGGRRGMVAAAALLGVGVPLGASRVVVGVVDLEDGDILWFQHSFAQGNLDLRHSADALTLLSKAMEGYSGR